MVVAVSRRPAGADFALAGADHGAGELEVIPLKHRRAEQLLPQLILFVESGGEIAGTGNTLFLRASPKNRAEIHALVDTLDTPPRRLMISVRQEGDDSGEAGGADVSGRVISAVARRQCAATREFINANGRAGARSASRCRRWKARGQPSSAGNRWCCRCVSSPSRRPGW